MIEGIPYRTFTDSTNIEKGIMNDRPESGIYYRPKYMNIDNLCIDVHIVGDGSICLIPVYRL